MCCVPGAHRASGYKNEYVLVAPTLNMEWLAQSPFGPRDLRIGAHENASNSCNGTEPNTSVVWNNTGS